MKSIFWILCLVSVPAFADINTVVPTDDWLFQAFKFVATAKGLTVSLLAVGVTQLLMLFFQTHVADWAGKWRLTVVSFLTVGSLVAGSLASGMSLSGIFGQAPVLAAVQVMIHQFYKQFFDKENG